MNNILEKEFDTYLLPNENILWVGAYQHSNSNTNIVGASTKKLVAVAVIAFFILLPSFLVSNLIAELTNINIWYFLVPIVSIVLLIVLRDIKNKYNRYNPDDSNTVLYAMTDKRILIKRGTINTKLSSIELKNIYGVELVEHYNNLCSIKIKEKSIKPKNDKNIKPNHQLIDTLENIDNGVELYKLLNTHINITI